MFKKSFFIFLLGLAVFQALNSQEVKPRVAVSAPVNSIGEFQYEIVSNAVKDTVVLTLSVMNKYEVISIPSEIEKQDLAALANDQNIDTIITGEILAEQGAACLIRLSVYDKQKKSIVLVKEETADTLLDIFDASDRITVSMLEAFSGVHIAYGMLSVVCESGTGEYQVYLNNMPAGSGTGPLPKILTGTYQVDIIQERPLGKVTLFSEKADIRENKNTKISISIPQITKDEIDDFTSIDRFILTNWFNKDLKKQIAETAEEGLAKASNPSSSFFSELAAKYEHFKELCRLEELFSSGKTGGNFSAQKSVIRDDNKPGFGRLIDKSMLPAVYQDEKAPDFPTGTTALLFDKRLSMAEALESKGIIPEVKSGDIAVDGKNSDWISIPPLLKDRTGNSRSTDGAGDIKTLQIARDDKYLYMHISTGQAKLTSGDRMWYQMYLTIPGGNINFQCYYNNGVWESQIGKWDNTARKTTELAKGVVKTGQATIECRFLLTDVYKHLEKGRPYFAMVQSNFDQVTLGRQIFF